MAELRCDVRAIEATIGNLRASEISITNFRDACGKTIHPWALPSLANAIGSIQHAISDLKSARRHIEMPMPATETEDYATTEDSLSQSSNNVGDILINPHSDIAIQ